MICEQVSQQFSSVEFFLFPFMFQEANNGQIMGQLPSKTTDLMQ